MAFGGYADPSKDPKNGIPKITPITTLGKLGDSWEAPFFGTFRGAWSHGVEDSEQRGGGPSGKGLKAFQSGAF